MLQAIFSTVLGALALVSSSTFTLPPVPGPSISPGVGATAAPVARSKTLELGDRLRQQAADSIASSAHAHALTGAVGRLPAEPLATALEASVADLFAEWFAAYWSYQSAYFDYTNQQILDLANARSPRFSNTEVARTAILEAMGGSYVLTKTWLWSVPSGSSYTTAKESGGSSASINSLVLLPWTFPARDLGTEPDFVNAALTPGYAPQNAAYFYSARFGAAPQQTGVAIPVPGTGVPTLALWPDTLISSSSVFSGLDIAALRQLDVLVGGLDWTLLAALIRPPFQPPQWNHTPGSDGAARLNDPCDIWDCIKWACSLYDAAIAAANQQYDAHCQAAWTDFLSDLDVNIESEAGMMGIFAKIGYGGQIGGAGQGDWSEYFDGFNEQNSAELDQDLENAKNNLKNAICQAINDLKSRVAWCVEECPEYHWLSDFLDSYFGSSGC